MLLHIVPILIVVMCSYMFAYNLGFYKNHKDELYGVETLMPALTAGVSLFLYYGMYWFFCVIGSLK
jgi:hypothetical protein